ncbi:sarcolemmal membrane-associated protein [Phymastichus coffea]|uniref:sarcolemmal membrane-associated protein n=1 Tax=Phymastichus coffea TaxID=108790 RepID=UPI00273BFC06|nr:sarcolemmal membrane-associated protein [Phymastichus coffea]XP_058789742.1 sarcolemmal membrane-associated protein [Phymastichus coffea]XP_058789743.1 sarcolemmal membrane-associated protein [Phymastichus coffea]XP_058789745.1 sarcolemmal membrane-associated protein [Phymastichus coffea]XP_058789746.1 sarcolemmal membrane-associated protein [Phymastichus coffea]XP_058789747.1 sarcolemmal membrane-associated protein [Phymastichus coffea]
MVIASRGFMQNDLDSIPGKNMSAIGILSCHDNSYPFQERTLPLGQPIKVGRSVARARAAIDNAIFDCKVLSRNHALLWYDCGKFYLKDTKSSNGTFVNSKRLSPSGVESTACEVCSGDIVQFGVDVVESTKKVTHGCIIATLKLYLPDGKEAKATISHSVAYVNVTLQDLYKLNQFIQEAGRRENALRSKLEYMQQLLEHTKLAANQSWKALILEDCLLSRLEMLESQVSTYSKSFGEDKLKIELATLLEDKIQYQKATKELLQKKVQEKRELIGKVQILRCLLSETEEETQSLHNVIKNNQNELQELAIKYIKAQQTLDETTDKLNKTKSKLKDVIQQSEKDKEKFSEQFEEKRSIEKSLHQHLENATVVIIHTYNQIHALKNYMQTLQDINFLSKNICILQDHVKPINTIDNILNKSTSLYTNLMKNTTLQDEKQLGNNFTFKSDDMKLNLLSYSKNDYLKNRVATNKSAVESNHKYILPPVSSNSILVFNNSIDNTSTNESIKQNNFFSESLADIYLNISSETKNENQNAETSEISDHRNKNDTNASANLIIKFSDNRCSDICDDTQKLQLNFPNTENFPNDLLSAHVTKINQQINNMLEKYENKSFDPLNQNKSFKIIQSNTEYIMNSLKPLTNNFTLSKFFQYLILKKVAQSSNFLEVSNMDERYNILIQELHDMKNWLLCESDEILINKLKIYYNQLESETQNIQELNEQLIILKEKYNTTMEENAYAKEKFVKLADQCKNRSNSTMVPIYYFVPIIFVLFWMLMEKIL